MIASGKPTVQTILESRIMRGEPAVLGGEPVFSEMLAFVKPALPATDSMMAEVHAMISEGRLTKGPHLAAFEQATAEHLGVKHAVAVSSCTIGLMLAYRGLGLQGEVIVPSFTFMATVSALVWAGLRPVFVDIDRETATVDPHAVERAITPRTSAIVAVHTFGNPAEIATLVEIAGRRGLPLLFDAAHGFGALYQGAPVGAQGDAHVFSLSPTKLLVAGEGGIVATNRNDLAEKVRLGREYGNDGTYGSSLAGLNGRMPEFSALLGLHGLPLLDGVACRRNAVAEQYRAELAGVPGLEFPTVRAGNRCSYKDFSIAIDSTGFGLDRDQLSVALAAEGVDTRKYFYPAVHRHAAYAAFNRGDDELPNTQWLAQRSLSLPMGSHVSDEVIQMVSLAIRRCHERARDIRTHLAAAPRTITIAPTPSLGASLTPWK